MRAVVVLSVLFVILVIGCNNAQPVSEKHPFADRIGKSCIVQFRRGDALGAAGNLPVPPSTGNINGADVKVSGLLRAVSHDWIAIESGDKEYCIPRDSILLVQFEKTK